MEKGKGEYENQDPKDKDPDSEKSKSPESPESPDSAKDTNRGYEINVPIEDYLKKYKEPLSPKLQRRISSTGQPYDLRSGPDPSLEPKSISKKEKEEPSIFSKFFTKNKKKLRKIASWALAFGLLGGGLAYREHGVSKHNLNAFFNALKEATYAGYQFDIDPSKENKKDYVTKALIANGIKNGLDIESIANYLADKNIKYLCYPIKIPNKSQPLESCFAGEIKKTFDQDGTKVTFVESENKGILPLEVKLEMDDTFNKNVTYENGTHEIIIDVSLIEKIAKKIQNKFKEYEENNKHCANNDNKCNLEMQAVYETVKGNKWLVAKKYEDAILEGILVHELQHNYDAQKGYDILEGETNALLQEVTDTNNSLIFRDLLKFSAGSGRGKVDPAYTKAAENILDCLRSSPKVKQDKDLLYLSKKDRKELGEYCRKKLLGHKHKKP